MKNATRARFHAFVRPDILGVALAIMTIHVASKELSLGGIADRLVQFAIAYALLCLSFRSNRTTDVKQTATAEEGEE